MIKFILLCLLHLCFLPAFSQDSIRVEKKKNPAQDSLQNKNTPYYYKREKSTSVFSNLTFGINLLLLASRGTAIDFNPYVSKQIAKHWTIGIGWNQRVSFSRARYGGNYTRQLFGPRIYVSYLLPHGFSLRLIPEIMEARLPRNLYVQGESRNRWEWSAFAGVKKDFKIGRKNIVYAELLYDVATTARQNLYGDVVNFRVGFELNRIKK